MSPTIDMKTIIKAALLSTFALYRLGIPFATAPQQTSFLAA